MAEQLVGAIAASCVVGYGIGVLIDPDTAAYGPVTVPTAIIVALALISMIT